MSAHLRNMTSTPNADWTVVGIHMTAEGPKVQCLASSIPTPSGKAEVRYKTGPGGMRGIFAKARCDEAQRAHLRGLFLAYLNAGGGGLYTGHDRVCLHDPAFPAKHDDHCDRIAWDALAEAMQIEIRSHLAETETAAD